MSPISDELSDLHININLCRVRHLILPIGPCVASKMTPGHTLGPDVVRTTCRRIIQNMRRTAETKEVHRFGEKIIYTTEFT